MFHLELVSMARFAEVVCPKVPGYRLQGTGHNRLRLSPEWLQSSADTPQDRQPFGLDPAPQAAFRETPPMEKTKSCNHKTPLKNPRLLRLAFSGSR
jgi:hypothetical protein